MNTGLNLAQLLHDLIQTRTTTRGSLETMSSNSVEFTSRISLIEKEEEWSPKRLELGLVSSYFPAGEATEYVVDHRVTVPKQDTATEP